MVDWTIKHSEPTFRLHHEIAVRRRMNSLRNNTQILIFTFQRYGAIR